MACDTKNNKESEKNIMENQIKAYDKAQGVENTLLKVEDERKKEMQRQGI